MGINILVCLCKGEREGSGKKREGINDRLFNSVLRITAKPYKLYGLFFINIHKETLHLGSECRT